MESSKLWQRGFGDEGTDENVSRLVTSLRVIRRNVEVLTSRIAVSLPELTIHDISHLDALWEVADTVAGSDFPLNPIEAYVFGAAVLLHDTGLCFEVYSGGRDALRETLEWRDAYGRLSRTPSDTENLEKEADFEALRALHASKAARLAIKPWRGDEEELYLIDDRELRENYGQLIGDLASSHHWNLEMVVSRFATLATTGCVFRCRLGGGFPQGRLHAKGCGRGPHGWHSGAVVSTSSPPDELALKSTLESPEPSWETHSQTRRPNSAGDCVNEPVSAGRLSGLVGCIRSDRHV